ncbi:MAG: D-glycerate dehydrogenase [bacterium]|nr:D-glycerate dehydrogenase [bacterium]
MPSVFVTRKIPEPAVSMLEEKGYDVIVSKKDGVLSKDELLEALAGKGYDAVLCLLTDTIDNEVFAAAKGTKIFANYAVGYNNIDIDAAKSAGVRISNTPGVLTETVAEHAFGLLMAIAQRIPEADRFTRAGRYVGWAPELMLGTDLRGKTLGILGAGRIGSQVARHGKLGFGMNIAYYDVQKNDAVESEFDAVFHKTPEELMASSDFVSVHVPLLESTTHLVNKERLSKMKKTAYLINTSRGPVVDEMALVEVLKEGGIAGAALDVFENEPTLAAGLDELENVIITPHIASASQETRSAMARIVAENIIAVLEGGEPTTPVV